jgi:hypothetical protein
MDLFFLLGSEDVRYILLGCPETSRLKIEFCVKVTRNEKGINVLSVCAVQY